MTLIELMAFLAVFSMVLGAVVTLSQGGFRVWNDTVNDHELWRESGAAAFGRGPMKGLVRDIQQAQRALATDPGELSLLVGVDTITYQLSGATLQRSVNGSPATASLYVSSAAFTYYELTGAFTLQESTTPARVVLIDSRVELSRKGKSVWSRVAAALRNL